MLINDMPLSILDQVYYCEPLKAAEEHSTMADQSGCTHMCTQHVMSKPATVQEPKRGS